MRWVKRNRSPPSQGLSALFIYFPGGCMQKKFARDHWVCTINNEGALKKEIKGAELACTSWPVQGFPATQRETRGSPALCVSGSFQGNHRQGVWCSILFLSSFPRASLGKLASFPESEREIFSNTNKKSRLSRRAVQFFRERFSIPNNSNTHT